MFLECFFFHIRFYTKLCPLVLKSMKLRATVQKKSQSKDTNTIKSDHKLPKVASVKGPVCGVDMIVLHLLDSPQTPTVTQLRQSISWRTLTISLSPHVTPQCQCYRPMGGLRVSLKARTMTSHTVAPGNMEGAEHSHLLTLPQHNKSVQVRRGEEAGEGERAT